MEFYTILLLFVVGFLYASVGHGDAGGYIAVLAIFEIPVIQDTPLILVLSMLVAVTGVSSFVAPGSLSGPFAWC